MEFKRKSNTKLSIKVNKISFDLEAEENGYQILNNIDNESISVTKPGEYESKLITFIGLEAPEENYNSKINILNVSFDNVGVLFIFKPIELTKEYIDALTNINVVVTNIEDEKYLKSLLKHFQPEKIVIIDRFLKQEEVNSSNLKTHLKVAEIIKDSKLKFNEKDFDSEEDKIFDVYILE